MSGHGFRDIFATGLAFFCVEPAVTDTTLRHVCQNMCTNCGINPDLLNPADGIERRCNCAWRVAAEVLIRDEAIRDETIRCVVVSCAARSVCIDTARQRRWHERLLCGKWRELQRHRLDDGCRSGLPALGRGYPSYAQLRTTSLDNLRSPAFQLLPKPGRVCGAMVLHDRSKCTMGLLQPDTAMRTSLASTSPFRTPRVYIDRKQYSLQLLSGRCQHPDRLYSRRVHGLCVRCAEGVLLMEPNHRHM